MTLKQHKLTASIHCIGPVNGMGENDELGSYLGFVAEFADRRHALKVSRGAAEALAHEITGAMHQASIPTEATGDDVERARHARDAAKDLSARIDIASDEGSRVVAIDLDDARLIRTALEQLQKRERELVEELEHFIDIIDGTEETGFDPHVEQMLVDAAETARKSIDTVSNDQG